MAVIILMVEGVAVPHYKCGKVLLAFCFPGFAILLWLTPLTNFTEL
jgi:hypothetical protein